MMLIVREPQIRITPADRAFIALVREAGINAVARRSGLSPTWVSRMICYDAVVPLETMRKVADATDAINRSEHARRLLRIVEGQP